MSGADTGGTGQRFAPVILAGGSGTRFWPRSRKSRAKQVLALDGDRTMIQQTVDRLLRVGDAGDIWVITNDLLREEIARQLPALKPEKILSEPAARNTAPACALAAFLLEKSDPGAVIGIFPSDHVVGNVDRFVETGYGYIERGAEVGAATEIAGGIEVRRVKRFTEKPHKALAESFFASGNYAWNSGMFLWSARTLACAIREHCPAMAPLMEKIAAAYGTPEFDEVFAEVYPQCENISIDYAVLEPRSAKGEEASEIYCLPADFVWNDLGCWSALHDHVADCGPEELALKNIFDKANQPCVDIDSHGNYVYAPGKAIALVGVSDLVVVETDDALLITTRERSQDVGKVVAQLKQAGREDLV
jgi:mannose-1-phosphate guanylyltransferase